jgi:hypothetical protein
MTTKPWPADPFGDMTPILQASVEAAMQRHPSTSGDIPGVALTAADRCDECSAAAAYRVRHRTKQWELDFCMHHWRKHFPGMLRFGWAVVGGNPDLLSELGEADGQR